MDSTWKKNTVLFIAGQAVTLFGSMIVQFAILWHIVLQTQSGTMMSLFTIAGFLPMFFISPFGGVWADRFNRKFLINIADSIIAFVSLVVAILLMMGYTHFGILLVCAIMRSFGQGVQTPAVGAVIPQIVPTEHLTRINGIQSSIQSICMLAAPMLSAVLMTIAPLQTLFFIDVVTATIGISILIFFVKVPSPEKTEDGNKETVYFNELRQGLQYIKENGYIYRLIIISALFMVFAAPAAMLTPLHVARKFGDDIWRLTAIEVAFSAGMIAGGILIGLWGGFKNRIFTIAFSCFLFGLATMGLGLMPTFWAYVGIMAVAGISMPLYNTPTMVLFQSTVEPAFMGRVLSVFNMVASAIMPMAMLLFGPISDIVNIDILLIITGVLTVLLCIPFLSSKVLREAGKINT